MCIQKNNDILFWSSIFTALDQNSSSNQKTKPREEVHMVSASWCMVSDSRPQFLRPCWLWLGQNNTSARQPAKSNQRKSFKTNGCARKEESFAALCSGPEGCFWCLGAKMFFVKVTKGSCDDTPCYFPSLLSSIVKKGTNWRWELQTILSLVNRGGDCFLSTRGSQTKTQAHVEALLVYRPLIDDDTKEPHSLQLYGCCWPCDISTHIALVHSSEKLHF